jgi:hypothetical protein
MSKRLPIVSLVAVIVVSFLVACSATDNRNLSGAAAKDALTTVVNNSEKLFLAEGGTETIYVGTKRYVLLYDPSAASEKQIAFQDLDGTDLPQLGSTEMIRITALKNLLSTGLPDGGIYKLSDNVFKIEAGNFTIQITVDKDLIQQAIVIQNSKDTTMYATTYGFSKDAKKLLSSATPSPTPVQ